MSTCPMSDSAPVSRNYIGLNTEQRQEKRREQLLAAGVELFGTAGYRATTVEAVCAEAGLTKRFYYESFTNREDLLIAVFERITTGWRAVVRSAVDDAAELDLMARIHAALVAAFGYMDADRRRARILFVEVLGVSPQVDRTYRDSMQVWTDFIGALIADRIPSAVRPDLLATAALSTINGMTAWWVVTDYRESTSDVVSAIEALFTGRLGLLEPS